MFSINRAVTDGSGRSMMNELNGLDYEGLELDFSRSTLQVTKIDCNYVADRYLATTACVVQCTVLVFDDWYDSYCGF